MLQSLIRFSIQNKLIIGILVIAMMGWGIYSMLNIPIDAVPDITNNQVQIVTVSPSLAAAEVEQFITYPIEMAMANVQDVEEIRSISRYGLSVVTVVFKENVPVLDARQLVGQQLQQAVNDIPEGYGEPSLMPITTGLGEIFQYTIDIVPGYEDKYSPTDLRTIHDWVVKRQLNGIPGIVEISSFGGFLKEYEVAVDPEILKSYNLTLIDINQALKKNNQNTGGSYVQKGPYAYYIRANGLLETIEDINNVVVATRNNIPILIGDVADVKIGHPVRFGAMTKNGKGEAVGGITLMIKGGNASKVIKAVKERIEQISMNLPEGLEIVPYLDRSYLVQKVINTVSLNLLEGGLIVVFILVLLLGNFRAGLIVASVIPLSLLFAFALMKVFDVTATVMSLGAIDFGLIVDATVIIIESILHNIEKLKEKKKLTAAEMDNVVLDTTLNIRNSALFGAIIILIVYFPILSLRGIEGKMFQPMALTVSFAIIGAMILSFTYVPMISSLFLSKKISTKRTIADKIMDLLYKTYSPIFNFALKNKISVLVITIFVFISSIFIFNRLGAEFIPDLDEGDLAMQMSIPQGSSLTQSVLTSTKAEKIILENFPEVKAVVSKIGTAEVPTDPMAIEDADIMIILKPRDEWVSADNREELVDKMKEKLEVIAGASFEFTQPIQLRFNELLTGAKADVVVKIYGEDLELLVSKANEVSKIISKIQGAADVKAERIEGLPQLVINYDRKKIARYGLNIEEINTMVRTALAGEKAGSIFEGERKFDLVVRLKEEYRTDLNKLKELFIKTPDGYTVPIDELASINFVESPVQISRDDTRRRISIGVNVRNRDVQSLVEEIQQEINKNVDLPAGYYFSYGGKFENLQSAMTRLKIVIPIALLLIFVLLYFAFGSLNQASIIFLTIPLSIIGGIISLWIRGLPFSISAGIGFIALSGVAVLDGIVLINYLNELKKRGVKDLHDRLIQATKNRLRPVAVTSAVASLGFLPMALSTSAGAEVQRPLATVVIGGIITATFLTMIVLPIVYYYFEKFSAKVSVSKATLIILGLFTFNSVNAQEVDTNYVSMDHAVEIALSNNIKLKNSVLRIERSQKLKQSTFDLGNTELNYTKGQINSDIKDYQWNIRQNFGSPLLNIAQNKVYKEQSNWEKANNEQIKRELKKEVQLKYVQWQLLNNEMILLKKHLLNYRKIIEIADIRYQTGETNYLSKLNLENKKEELSLQLKQVEISLKIAERLFNLNLQTDSVLIPESVDYPKLQLIINSDSLEQLISDHPKLLLNQVNTKIADQKIKWEQATLSPSVYAGYFNQQIDNVKGFQGWEIGISMPLWFLPKQKKIKVAKIEQEIANNDLYFTKKYLLKETETLLDHFKMLSEKINYYEISVLKREDVLIRNANILYQNGEIGYIEYIQNIESALKIRQIYIEYLRNYNETVIKLNYLNK